MGLASHSPALQQKPVVTARKCPHLVVAPDGPQLDVLDGHLGGVLNRVRDARVVHAVLRRHARHAVGAPERRWHKVVRGAAEHARLPVAAGE
eukprot:5111386-Pyramimonas_sp.AAC.1